MRCMDPQIAWRDSQGKTIYRNFSFIDPQMFPKNPTLVTGCRKCIICRKKQAYELAQRCVLHSSLYSENCFLTLTYDETKEGYNNQLHYKDIQDFKKRLRSHCKRDHNKKIEIFNVHEYGKNGKKHWHLLVFNHAFPDRTLYTSRNGNKVYRSKKLEELWDKGLSEFGSVSEASAMYQAQYMEKDFKHGYVTSTKKSKSNHSGLGKGYFLKNYPQILSLGYIPIGGNRMPLPRYFEKIAHRHYSHFYEPSHFVKGSGKEARYRPFKKEKPIKELADLWPQYEKQKKDKIKDLETEWENVILLYQETQQSPDFYKSGQNALYDLQKKSRKENF